MRPPLTLPQEIVEMNLHNPTEAQVITAQKFIIRKLIERIAEAAWSIIKVYVIYDDLVYLIEEES